MSPLSNPKKHFKQTFVVLAVVGFVLRLAAMLGRSMWMDEVDQMLHVRAPLKYLLLEHLPSLPGGFPGDYLLTWPLAQLVQPSLAAAELVKGGLPVLPRLFILIPHFMTMAVFFYAFYRISQRAFSSTVGAAVAFGCVVFNHHLILHALEFRPYAALPALSTGFFLWTGHLLRKERVSLAARLAFAGAVAVVTPFHAYGIMMVGLSVVYHVLFAREGRSVASALRTLAPSVALGFLVVSPVWYFYASAATSYPDLGSDPHVFSGSGPVRMFAFVFGNLGNLSVRYLWVVPFLVVASAFVIRDESWRRRAGLLTVMILVPIAAIYISDVRQHYWFLQRQFIWTFPFWALLVGLSTESLIRRWKAV